jgi:hypothetical protein
LVGNALLKLVALVVLSIASQSRALADPLQFDFHHPTATSGEVAFLLPPTRQPLHGIDRVVMTKTERYVGIENILLTELKLKTLSQEHLMQGQLGGYLQHIGR